MCVYIYKNSYIYDGGQGAKIKSASRAGESVRARLGKLKTRRPGPGPELRAINIIIISNGSLFPPPHPRRTEGAAINRG